MRVLQISDGYPPATGGTERVVAALAKGLVAQGHPTTVATLGRPGVPDRETVDGVEVHRLDGFTRYLRRFASDPGHFFHPTFPDPLLVSRLQSLVDEVKPDIVHAHGWILNSCLPLHLGGAALVSTLHDYGLNCAKKTMIHQEQLDDPCPGPSPLRCLKCAGQFYGPLKGTPITLGLRESRRRLDRVSLFLPISAAVEKASLDGVPAHRIERIPSFVDDSVFDEARNTPRPEFLPDGPFVLFVGALGEHKGLGLSVEAHQKMRTALPLVVIGSRRADTRSYTGSSDRVVVTHTAVPHEQIMASLTAAAVAVVPSRWQEPLGLVAIEAMAAITPVVATRVGALAEVVQHQRTGLVVPPNDSTALAAAIDALVDDPALARKYAAAGVRRAREYTASAVIPRVIAAYDRASSGTRAA